MAQALKCSLQKVKKIEEEGKDGIYSKTDIII
jgi:hypothetical protein